jgi:hypothetical protein
LGAIAISTLLFSGSTLMAQPGPGGGPGGNFDPAQMRQQMMDRMREQFDVKDDAEWKLISTRIEKVMEARREAGGGFGGGMMGGMRPQRRNADANADPNQPQQQRRRGGMGGAPNPDVEALQKAVDDKATADELKAKMAKVRESRKAGEAKLEAAQEDLRKVLNTKQEAVALLNNLLK